MLEAALETWHRSRFNPVNIESIKSYARVQVNKIQNWDDKSWNYYYWRILVGWMWNWASSCCSSGAEKKMGSSIQNCLRLRHGVSGGSPGFEVILKQTVPVVVVLVYTDVVVTILIICPTQMTLQNRRYKYLTVIQWWAYCDSIVAPICGTRECHQQETNERNIYFTAVHFSWALHFFTVFRLGPDGTKFTVNLIAIESCPPSFYKWHPPLCTVYFRFYMKFKQLFPVYKPEFRYSMSDTLFSLSDSSTTHSTIERNHSSCVVPATHCIIHYICIHILVLCRNVWIFSSLLLHDDSQLMLYFWYLPADSDLNYRANVVLFQVIGTHKNALALWKRDAESCLLWEEAELVFNGLLIRWIKTKWSHFSLYNFCNYVHTVILILNKRIKVDLKACVFFPWHKLIGNYCNALQIAISHK